MYGLYYFNTYRSRANPNRRLFYDRYSYKLGFEWGHRLFVFGLTGYMKSLISFSLE